MSPRTGAALLAPLLLLAPVAAGAQWRPTGPLAAVPVVKDCDETGGDAMVSRLDPPTVYLCPRVIALVRRTNPGAEHFFYVHEFGHIALQTADEALADCWAARQLAAVPGGRRTIAAAIALFRRRPADDSARYGSPQARADRIEACADERPAPP